ncbi:MAG: hypothetical protein QNK37_07730 [Acidobacteriota bacterium]|nr:hypothetical protein [Acidobacteriota bacterium]
MKKCLIILCLAIPLGFTATPGPEMYTMEGSYVWTYSRKSPGKLKAEFTHKRGDRWSVVFYFRFDGRNRVYKGTAEGNLENGSLKGTVKNENKQRTFTFQGTSIEGKFSGTHAEIKRNGEKKTGTLKLNLQ